MKRRSTKPIILAVFAVSGIVLLGLIIYWPQFISDRAINIEPPKDPTTVITTATFLPEMAIDIIPRAPIQATWVIEQATWNAYDRMNVATYNASVLVDMTRVALTPAGFRTPANYTPRFQASPTYLPADFGKPTVTRSP